MPFPSLAAKKGQIGPDMCSPYPPLVFQGYGLKFGKTLPTKDRTMDTRDPNPYHLFSTILPSLPLMFHPSMQCFYTHPTLSKHVVFSTFQGHF
jgi:hypothetical protein